MLFARLLLTVMLSCTLISDVSFQTHDAPQASITVHTAANYNQATIKKVQKKLNSCGYDCGNPDGIAGSKTKKAVKKIPMNLRFTSRTLARNTTGAAADTLADPSMPYPNQTHFPEDMTLVLFAVHSYSSLRLYCFRCRSRFQALRQQHFKTKF